ncbi:MAG: hypothetical protein ACJ73S_18850 [Mycobacteriales bacterium]|jgi:hypothetical protein
MTRCWPSSTTFGNSWYGRPPVGRVAVKTVNRCTGVFGDGWMVTVALAKVCCWKAAATMPGVSGTCPPT